MNGGNSVAHKKATQTFNLKNQKKGLLFVLLLQYTS